MQRLSLKKKSKPEPKLKKNTAVYVTGLPLDTNIEEIAEYFKKGGVFVIDPLTGLPKIKVYHDSTGACKGDALVIYLREESVQLACQLLDDTRFRYTEKASIKVLPAVFEKEKAVEEDPLSRIDKKAKQKAISKMKKCVLYLMLGNLNGSRKKTNIPQKA